MGKVCVIGGGSAGMEAAREAALLGAEVTILERSPRPELPWKAWPSLLSRTHPVRSPRPSRLPGEEGVDLVTGAEVESVLDGRAATAGGRCVRADAFVVATGSFFAPPRFLGGRKSGVWVLDSASRYSSLEQSLDAVPRAVVAGEGARGLEVSERLRNRGCAVTLCLSRWDAGTPALPLLEVLTEAALASGVRVESGVPERAVGAGTLEGVLLRGNFIPCGAFVVLPPRFPAPVRTGALVGTGGGLLVDRWLRTSVPELYAAGGCAETDSPRTTPSSFEDAPTASGRVAGANAAGRAVAISSSGFHSVKAFGLLWWRAGASPGRLPRSGEPEVFGRRWGPDSACSITYDGRSGAVLALEAVAPEGVGSRLDHVATLERATLHNLAYGSQPSTDISMVSDTARLALAHWQGSLSATTSTSSGSYWARGSTWTTGRP